MGCEIVFITTIDGKISFILSLCYWLLSSYNYNQTFQKPFAVNENC
jgi:hypothetical protein